MLEGNGSDGMVERMAQVKYRFEGHAFTLLRHLRLRLVSILPCQELVRWVYRGCRGRRS